LCSQEYGLKLDVQVESLGGAGPNNVTSELLNFSIFVLMKFL